MRMAKESTLELRPPTHDDKRADSRLATIIVMQYDADSPAEYLSMLADDWRKTKLLEVRAFLKKHAPNLKETIQYKMLSYADDAGEFVKKAMAMRQRGEDFGC